MPGFTDVAGFEGAAFPSLPFDDIKVNRVPISASKLSVVGKERDPGPQHPPMFA
jgi:hypothetical protein